MLPSIQLPDVAAGRSITGEMGLSQVEDLQKSLTAGYGTDVAALTGGGALRIQSLDKTMMATIQENQHFTFFNKVAKEKAGATVDEWTEQSGVGGFLGGSTNTETGTIAAATGQYDRRVGYVKYMMTRREVSFVQTLQNAITDSEAAEQNNGALQLLTDGEYLSFEGNSSVVPTEFDGIEYQIASLNSADHVLDAEASAFASINLLNNAAATISGFGNFGRPTDVFMSNLTQADFDNGLDPAFRVSLSGTGQDIMLGAPVVGIRTSHGNIKTQPDVFIRDGDQKIPFQNLFPALAAANTFQPQSVVAGTPASDASSKFKAAHAGSYYYAVAGVNAAGQSVIVKSAQVAIAAGEKVAITITRSTAQTETGYVIYRSRMDGSNVTSTGDLFLSDFREVVRIPVSGAATTVWTDLNRDIPGTTKAFILNMTPSQKAITWRQLLPMLRFPLYPTVSAVIPWAQLMFGYLRISKRKHHVVIKNILPGGAVWRPFG